MPDDSSPPDRASAGDCADLVSYRDPASRPDGPGSPAPQPDEALGAAGTSGPFAVSPAWPVTPLPAEVDIVNAGQVRADLLAVIDRGYPVVVADMSRTSFCDCAGVSALLTAGSYAARRGAQLRVVAGARAVLRTFELTGLPLALPVYAASADALREPDTARTWQSSGGTPAARTVTRLRTGAAGSGPRPDRPRCP